MMPIENGSILPRQRADLEWISPLNRRLTRKCAGPPAYELVTEAGRAYLRDKGEYYVS